MDWKEFEKAADIAALKAYGMFAKELVESASVATDILKSTFNSGASPEDAIDRLIEVI